MNVLLTNIENVKNLTNISDNVNGKVLQMAVRESQDIELQEIIGTTLYNKLIELVRDGEVSVPGNEAYADLMDIIQIFLSYCAVVKVIIPLAYKIDNMGVVQAKDDNVDPLNIDDIYNVLEYYKKRADYYGGVIQKYIIKHRNELELDECSCNNIKAHLDSSANTSIWLGGARGTNRFDYKNDFTRNY